MECPAGVSWQVRRFCRQYLQVVEPSPVYPDGALLREEEVQELLYNELFAATGDRIPSPPPAYALRVLKTLMAKIEASIDDWDKYGVSDSLMMCLAELATSQSHSSGAPGSPIAKHGVTYYISALEGTSRAAPCVTLLENRSTIAACGTTGIRTWEAALHLGNYLCANPNLVRGKKVLELGAGTGFVSILCAKHLDSSYCIATDGSMEVVDGLPANIRLNDLRSKDAVSPKQLLWGGDTLAQEFEDSGYPDVVVGADITFDERDMPDLLKTTRILADLNEDASILIAATERNQKTYDAFISLAAASFQVDEIDFPVSSDKDQAGPFYSSLVPIRICQLRLKRNNTSN